MKSILCASLALVAGAAFAGVSQDFESTGTGSLPTATADEKWVGDGTVAEGATVVPTVGSPTSSSSSTKFLAVNGTVSCSNLVSSTAAYSKADFLLFVDEAGDDPEDVIAGAQIAVAAGEGSTANANDSYIWIYCKNGDPASNAWFKTDIIVPTQTWARVTLDFDYINARCQVSINGEAANSSAGYVKSSGDATGGSWYPTIHTISGNSSKLSELTIVGSTKVDDVLISESGTPIAQSFAGGVTVDGVTVPYDYLANYSIKTNDVGSTVSGSGMTVAQKYETGLDPTDATSFKATSMTLAAAGQSASVTIPCVDKSGITYQVIFKGANGTQIGSAVDAIAGEVSNGLVPLTFNMPETTEKVLQIQVTATKSNS